ncbi:hypothetical protein B0H14DRAFT_3877887 [Mycena olivaceomarginata]|nr:hypothetical protein B0H14DRAFT_3877887 [Mycena olivaceomarginata]
MSPSYSLFIESANGIQWHPSGYHRNAPNLYVKIYQDAMKMHRTLTVKRELKPRWDDSSTLLSSEDPASVITVKIFHKTSAPLFPDSCIGRLDIRIDALLKLCTADGGSKVVNLELTGVDGKLKGEPVGTISLRLQILKPADAAAAQMMQWQSYCTHFVYRASTRAPPFSTLLLYTPPPTPTRSPRQSAHDDPEGASTTYRPAVGACEPIPGATLCMLGWSVQNDPARCRPARAAVLDGNPSSRADADADPLLSILSISFSSGSGRDYDDRRGEVKRRGAHATQRIHVCACPSFKRAT